MSKTLNAFRIGTAIALLAVSSAAAQTITVEGGLGDPAAAAARELLQRGDYILLSRDTVLPRGGLITGDLVVVNGRIALEGAIGGSVLVLGGDFFVRPRAMIAGNIAVLGGDAYVSGLAQAGAVLRVDPRLSPTVVPGDPDLAVVLTAPPPPGLIRLPNLFGLGLPTYDRVNGLSVGWSGQLGIGGDTATVGLHGTAVLRAARRQLDGGLELRLQPTYRTMVGIRATRTTRSNERWIRGDLANTLATLFSGSDMRNYYETSEASVYLARTPPPSIVQGQGYIVPRVQIAISQDRSIPEADVWALFSGAQRGRPNPPIGEGTLASVSAAALAEWRGAFSRFNGGAAVEWAPGTLGDFRFAQLTATGFWSMRALFNHQIRVAAHTRLPIGSDEAPAQRWSFIGGAGTLPTFETSAMRGDHVLFVHSFYIAPVPFVSLPLVGVPALRLEHAAGTAWRTGDPMPLLEQNVGAGIQASFLHAILHLDPTARPLRPVLSVGFDLPRGPPLLFF